jgi:hypothetical protein
LEDAAGEAPEIPRVDFRRIDGLGPRLLARRTLRAARIYGCRWIGPYDVEVTGPREGQRLLAYAKHGGALFDVWDLDAASAFSARRLQEPHVLQIDEHCIEIEVGVTGHLQGDRRELLLDDRPLAIGVQNESLPKHTVKW